MQDTRLLQKGEATSLDKLLGETPTIISHESLHINPFIQADLLTISLSNLDCIGEDGGRLFVYPIADGEYCLHLLILPTEQSTDEPEVCWLKFAPEFFQLFGNETLLAHAPFRFDKTIEQQFSVSGPIKLLVDQLKNAPACNALLQSMVLTEIALQILRRVIESITMPFTTCTVPACRFLTNETEREKIFDARAIIDSTIEQPLTIKELSRKVAINECYLKKGFKTLFGKTINEYQQSLRINKAKELLQLKGQTVSEVASILGYSSISHFSTAFKKATGLKPCELLG